MLKECSKRKFVKQCETCLEIMAADAFLPHVAAGACKSMFTFLVVYYITLLN